MKKLLLWMTALIGALIITACGGGGLSVSGNLPLFLTDSFREDYSHVWLRVQKVEFRDATTGVFAASFQSADGVLVDAKKLRDGSGERFSFLGKGSLPDGTYDQVKVTLAAEVILVPTGSDAGQSKTLSNPEITANLSPVLTVPASSPFVIDFDLANFAISGESVTGAIRQGSNNGIGDGGRHESDNYRGTVAELTDTGFHLNAEEGAGFDVHLNGDTPITHGWNGAPATLHNGQKVEVEGIFLPDSGVLTATHVKVQDGGDHDDQAEAKGQNTEVNLDANTMILADITGVEHFTPQGSTVNVTWTDQTVIRRGGVAISEGDLNTFRMSEVKGVYDEATNTIAATSIRLENEEGGDGTAEAKGVAQEVNLDNNSMVLGDIFGVSGFEPSGTSVQVAWTGETVFRNGDNNTSEEMLVLQGGPFEVEGVYNADTHVLTASRIRKVN